MADGRTLYLETAQKLLEQGSVAAAVRHLIWYLRLLDQRLSQDSTQTSSAPPSTDGPVERPCVSWLASPDSMREHLRTAITASFRSTPSTTPELVESSPNSSTLQLTLRWPTPSGSTLAGAGSPGPVVPELSQGEVGRPTRTFISAFGTKS